MITRTPTALWASPRSTPSAAMLAGLILLIYLGITVAGPIRPPESVTPCIPCHNRVGNDQVGEWLASPYSQVAGGRGCTGCHRGRCRGIDSIAARNRHVTDEIPRTLEVAARLTVSVVCSADGVEAEVVVTNLGAGHDLPTGPAGRTLILQVTAHAKDGTRLSPRELSEIAGTIAALEGATGRIFVKRPLAGNPELYRSRLAPFETDVSRHHFRAPEREPALVKARLLLSEPNEASSEIASAASICSQPLNEREASPSLKGVAP